ncbi:MAG TPA: nucleoside monophosphate kinase [Candidatus Paceibacterota bacterium]|nr:nucleoside monophosphate kinase [Candidatus Paceibacterota bacterium]HMP19129.1 nucleoside monophosphate kinase [Candidatus Paceibacterota bacterium]HMP85162.1 nucleoside monophosphate kinase [Candidatus Paceibacterota bacterium]
MELLTVIFIGRSGSGKGTQIEKVSSYVKSVDQRPIFHLEAGESFRNFIKDGTYSSNLAKEVNDRGGLQPEFLSVWAWTGEIVRKFGPNQHLFIDGTPRRLSEAKILESVFDFFDRKKVKIVYLNVSRNWSIEKMKNRGRNDDKEMSDILARLDWFDSDVVPVLDYYRSHRVHEFIEINGEQSIEDVNKDILIGLEI